MSKGGHAATANTPTPYEVICGTFAEIPAGHPPTAVKAQAMFPTLELRYMNGKLQQRWQVLNSFEKHWFDVPEYTDINKKEKK